MLWTKSFHLIFVVTWYAGLLYLPRLFVYHAMSDDVIGIERFKVMERKLFAITTIGGAGALVFGLWLLFDDAWSAYSTSLWLPLKLFLVAVLVAFHILCGKLMLDFRDDRNRHGHRFYRILNEIPAIILIAVIILVVVKPL
ncbi:MAG: TIGR00701 family protein [Gammaproteobacteria bacterium]|nr:MAG: TIGR00701 family protein [Gammaproteobacteria bacterium]